MTAPLITPRLVSVYDSSRALPDQLQSAQRAAEAARDHVRAIAKDDKQNTKLPVDHPAVAGIRAMADDLLDTTWWDLRNSQLPPTSASVSQAREGLDHLKSIVKRADAGPTLDIDAVGNDFSAAAKSLSSAWSASLEDTRSLATTVRLLAGHGGDPQDSATFKTLGRLQDGIASATPHIAKAKAFLDSAVRDLNALPEDDGRFRSRTSLPPTLGPNLNAADVALVEAYQNSGVPQPTRTYATAQDAGELVAAAERELYDGDTGWNDVDVEHLRSAVDDAADATEDALRASTSEVAALKRAADLVRRDPERRSDNWHRGPWNEPADWTR